MNEFQNIRNRFETMKRADLKQVALLILDGLETSDISVVKKALRLYDTEQLPSQQRNLKQTQTLAELLVNSIEGQYILIMFEDVIEIAFLRPTSSTEVVMGLSVRYPAANLCPDEGIHRVTLAMVFNILTLAGFHSSHSYDKYLKKTKRAWLLMDAVKHLSVEEIKTNTKRYLKDAAVSTDEIFGGLI